MKGIRNASWWLPLAAMLLNAPAQAAVPAAPAVSVIADFKQLSFLWSRVPQATHYDLYYLPRAGGTWVRYARLPGWRTSVAVNISAHFLHWNEARYVLKACNPAGCGSSRTLGVSHLMQQTVGILRPPAEAPYVHVGQAIDLSEDGSTLAATSRHNLGVGGGGVEVFRKSSSGWEYETRLLGNFEVPLYHPDLAVAVSGNGNVIALGVETDIPPGAEAEEMTGAVYVFRRTSAGWVREQRLTVEQQDHFGWRVDLDESGTLLAVWRLLGDPPYQVSGQGVVELFRYSGGVWVRHATIPVLNERCDALALSGDGNTVVRSCRRSVEVFTGPTWQRVATLPDEAYSHSEFPAHNRAMAIAHDGRSFAVRSSGAYNEAFIYERVNVYRLGASGWTREASLAPGEWDPNRYDIGYMGFGLGVAMSRDGRFLAVGNPDDRAAGDGVLYPPIARSGELGGAVYVYERKPWGWILRQFIKPNTEIPYSFGGSVAFARNGKDLAVSAYGDLRGSLSLY